MVVQQQQPVVVYQERPHSAKSDRSNKSKKSDKSEKKHKHHKTQKKDKWFYIECKKTGKVLTSSNADCKNGSTLHMHEMDNKKH
jgi:uncharacterized OB-fold protein